MLNKIKLLIGAPKYKLISQQVNSLEYFNFLDVGGGSGRALIDFKTYFPKADYSCIDLLDEQTYENLNKGLYKQYWKIDLSSLDFSAVPDNYFDFIACTHVIEHLLNGDEMLLAISKKLKEGGFIYVEYPGKKSLHLPSMPGTLNFFDDETHCRIYSEIELNNLFMRNQLKPVQSGTRRNWYRIILSPILIAYKLLLSRSKGTIAYEFWDLLGFAEFIYAKRDTSSLTINPHKFK